MDNEVKFLADAMLGRLARWLRVIGCDTAYYPVIDDAELARLGVAEGRLILTRDTLLIQRRLVRDNHFLVQGDHWPVQLRQVVEAFRLDLRSRFLTRCLECNAPLLELTKLEMEGKVPTYVLETQEVFKSCASCGRVYWGGTHRQQMEEILRNLFPAR